MRVTTVTETVNKHGGKVTREYHGISRPRVDDTWVAVVFTQDGTDTWGLDEPASINTLVRYYADHGVPCGIMRLYTDLSNGG